MEVQSKRYRVRPELCLFLLGGVLVFSCLGSKTLWTDEISIDWMTQWDVATTISHCRGATGFCYSPPLGPLIVFFAKRVSDTEFMIRLPSAIVGLLLLVVFWKCTSEFIPRKAALASMALMAVSPCFVYHAQDARLYILMSLCTVTSTWLMIRAVYRPVNGFWPLYLLLALVNAVNLYLSYFAWLALGIMFVVFFVLLSTSAAARAESRKRKSLYFLSAYALTALSYLPWLKDLLAIMQRHTSGQVAPSAVVTLPFVGNLLLELCGGGWTGVVILGCVIIGAVYAAIHARVVFLCGLLSLALSLAFLAMARPSYEFSSRYFFFLHPLLMVAGGTGLWCVAEMLLRKTRIPSRAIIAFLSVVIAIPSSHDLYHYYRVDRSGWKKAADFIAQNLPPETLLLPGIHFSNASLNRYLIREHPTFEKVRLDPQLDYESLREVILSCPNLWYVTHAWTHHDPKTKKLITERLIQVADFEGYDPYRHVYIFVQQNRFRVKR
ncbi:MAG TPA: glycosyltransferase family 39 protein [bacterium]|nr:glycosyltransferase family 39 protein [bacterium]